MSACAVSCRHSRARCGRPRTSAGWNSMPPSAPTRAISTAATSRSSRWGRWLGEIRGTTRTHPGLERYPARRKVRAMRSRAQVLVGPGEFDLREIEAAEPGPGQLRLRVHACGICGSDKVLAWVSAPGTILGHEVIAEVESCGPGVTGWRVGDRAIPIGDHLGMSAERGGYSEWITIAADVCIPVPERVPSLQAVIGEPMGNGLHFVRRARFRPGQRVAILGAGQIGLSIVYWVKRLGAGGI